MEPKYYILSFLLIPIRGVYAAIVGTIGTSLRFAAYWLMLLSIFPTSMDWCVLHAQGLINSGANIVITNTSTVIIRDNTSNGIKDGNYLNQDGGGNPGQIILNGTMLVASNWTNNATSGTPYVINPVVSSGTVKLVGEDNQIIGGTTLTKFKNLTLDNSDVNLDGVGAVLGITDVSVAGVLNLTNSAFTLNGKKLIIDNTSTGAITRTNGYILSNTEDLGFNSKLQWNIGGTINSFTIPFGFNAATYIPFIFNQTAAGAGNLIVSTYPSDGVDANGVYADKPPVVTNLDGACGNPDPPECAGSIVKRFWDISCVGSTADITFYWAVAEDPVDGLTDPMRAQRYDVGEDQWDYPLAGQTYNPARWVRVPGVTNFSPWAISKGDALLPIELLSFTASCKDGTAQINWTTATEINNDYFTIEKCRHYACVATLNDWEIVAIIPGAGNSNTIQNYFYIDANPYETTYYRLKQTDYDGNFTYSDIISTQCEEGEYSFELVDVISNQYNGNEITVLFNAPGNEEYTLYLYDLVGQLLFSKKDISTYGLNYVKLDVSQYQPSMYLLVLQNHKAISKKIIIY